MLSRRAMLLHSASPNDAIGERFIKQTVSDVNTWNACSQYLPALHGLYLPDTAPASDELQEVAAGLEMVSPANIKHITERLSSGAKDKFIQGMLAGLAIDQLGKVRQGTYYADSLSGLGAKLEVEAEGVEEIVTKRGLLRTILNERDLEPGTVVNGAALVMSSKPELGGAIVVGTHRGHHRLIRGLVDPKTGEPRVKLSTYDVPA